MAAMIKIPKTARTSGVNKAPITIASYSFSESPPDVPVIEKDKTAM